VMTPSQIGTVSGSVGHRSSKRKANAQDSMFPAA